MLLNYSEKFLLRRAYAKGAKALYEAYLKRSENSAINDRSIHFLKAFVQFPVSECIWIIRSNSNNHLSNQKWGEEYIHLVSLIAAYYLDKNEIMEGLLWADKAIRLIDFFAPTLDEKIREEILYNLAASAMVCAFSEEYLNTPYESFVLDWELNNQNTKNNLCNDNSKPE